MNKCMLNTSKYLKEFFFFFNNDINLFVYFLRKINYTKTVKRNQESCAPEGEERIGTKLAYGRDPEQHVLTFGGEFTLFSARIVLAGRMSMTRVIHFVTC